MRIRPLFVAAMMTATAIVPGFGQAAPFDEAPVSDSALSDQRGGFALPGGIQVNLAVQSDTRVNGQLVLRTVLIAAQSAPTLSVFVGNGGPTPSATTAAGGTTINIITRAPTISDGTPAGMTQVALAPGQSVNTASGQVSYQQTGNVGQVVLDSQNLEVRQLVGQAFGTIVSNRGNDMTIDTSTMINIDLSGAPPLSFGSAMPRLDSLATDAARFGH